MNSEELKKIQAPIKESYRQHPERAVITLKAQGKISEGISCKVDTGRALITAGLHPATGGNGMFACSGDMLLEALAACAGVTLSAVATAIGIEIKDVTVNAEGDIDFRGTLGISREVDVGFQAIRLSFDIDADVTDDQIQTLAKLTERYCVVYQTLKKGNQITTTYNRR
jgi:uncharacterized OsmC-like protein